MARFPNQEPDREASLPWTFVRLDSGAVWRGFLAGPIVRVHCHVVGRYSKPCRRRFSAGALPCALCDEEKQPTFYRGYAPLWSETGAGWFTVLGERYLPLAMTVKHMEPVRVTKLTARGSPIRMERDVKPVGVLSGEVSHVEADLTPWLLQVWGDPVIRVWASDTYGARDTPLSLPAVPAPRDTPVSLPAVPKRVGRDQPTRAEADMPAAGAALQGALARLRARAKGVVPEPSTNGSHADRPRQKPR